MEISNTDPRTVYPVPRTAEEQIASGLVPSPIMAGDVKPAHDGRYLRYFDDVDDWGWSEFIEGRWTRDGFFDSDLQEAPWRGGVLNTGNEEGLRQLLSATSPGPG